MYGVYKITNNINNKIYIGSSQNIPLRWRQHINVSKEPKSKQYTYPLYCAFRKYGVENFSFEVLYEGFENQYDMEEYEHDMIILYNSLTSSGQGYNQTEFTHPEDLMKNKTFLKGREERKEKISQKCAEVDKDNNIIQIFNSYQEAGRIVMGKSNRGSTIRRICEGDCRSYLNRYFKKLDKDNNIIECEFKTQKRRKNGVAIDIENPNIKYYFDSILQAAQIFETDRKSIQKCIKGEKKYSVVKGYIFRLVDENNNIIENEILIADKIQEYNETNPLINGERHTITEWCEIYGISTNSYYKRRKKGMSVIEAITTPKRR